MSRKTASTSRVAAAAAAPRWPSRRSTHLADPRVAAEQEGELVERRPLVVDDEHPERRAAVGHACTPGANFGTRTVTLVPAPGAVSTTRPYSSPNAVRSRSSTLPSPTESDATRRRPARGVPARGPRRRRRPRPRSPHSRSWSRGHDRDACRRPAWPSSPCRTAFSTSGWRHRNGTRHRQHLRGDPQRHAEPVAEPGLLEQRGSARSSGAPRRAW